jgi:hypothetical protein
MRGEPQCAANRNARRTAMRGEPQRTANGHQKRYFAEMTHLKNVTDLRDLIGLIFTLFPLIWSK